MIMHGAGLWMSGGSCWLRCGLFAAGRRAFRLFRKALLEVGLLVLAYAEWKGLTCPEVSSPWYWIWRWPCVWLVFRSTFQAAEYRQNSLTDYYALQTPYNLLGSSFFNFPSGHWHHKWHSTNSCANSTVSAPPLYPFSTVTNSVRSLSFLRAFEFSIVLALVSVLSFGFTSTAKCSTVTWLIVWLGGSLRSLLPSGTQLRFARRRLFINRSEISGSLLSLWTRLSSFSAPCFLCTPAASSCTSLSFAPWTQRCPTTVQPVSILTILTGINRWLSTLHQSIWTTFKSRCQLCTLWTKEATLSETHRF